MFIVVSIYGKWINLISSIFLYSPTYEPSSYTCRTTVLNFQIDIEISVRVHMYTADLVKRVTFFFKEHLNLSNTINILKRYSGKLMCVETFSSSSLGEFVMNC